MNTLKKLEAAVNQTVSEWMMDGGREILSPGSHLEISIQEVAQKPEDLIRLEVKTLNDEYPSEDILKANAMFELVNMIPNGYISRIKDAFVILEIETIEDLALKERRDFLKFRNFGKKTLSFVEGGLKVIHPRLRLGMLESEYKALQDLIGENLSTDNV